MSENMKEVLEEMKKSGVVTESSYKTQAYSSTSLLNLEMETRDYIKKDYADYQKKYHKWCEQSYGEGEADMPTYDEMNYRYYIGFVCDDASFRNGIKGATVHSNFADAGMTISDAPKNINDNTNRTVPSVEYTGTVSEGFFEKDGEVDQSYVKPTSKTDVDVTMVSSPAVSYASEVASILANMLGVPAVRTKAICVDNVNNINSYIVSERPYDESKMDVVTIGDNIRNYIGGTNKSNHIPYHFSDWSRVIGVRPENSVHFSLSSDELSKVMNEMIPQHIFHNIILGDNNFNVYTNKIARDKETGEYTLLPHSAPAYLDNVTIGERPKYRSFDSRVSEYMKYADCSGVIEDFAKKCEEILSQDLHSNPVFANIPEEYRTLLLDCVKDNLDHFYRAYSCERDYKLRLEALEQKRREEYEARMAEKKAKFDKSLPGRFVNFFKNKKTKNKDTEKVASSDDEPTAQ